MRIEVHDSSAAQRPASKQYLCASISHVVLAQLDCVTIVQFHCKVLRLSDSQKLKYSNDSNPGILQSAETLVGRLQLC